MLRSILATVAGIAAAVILITVMQAIGHALFPPPDFVDPTELDRFAEYVKNLPLPAKLWIALSDAIGTTGGVFIAAYFGRPLKLPALLVAGFILAGAVWNLTAIPHPPWLSIVDLCAILMGALTGFGLSQGRTGRGPTSDAAP